MTTPRERVPRGSIYPIVEAYGYPHDSTSPAAEHAWAEQACPFADGPCEKKIQYGYGYCSVVYSAAWDNGSPRPYAVCDHRLDGGPIRWAVEDHFGAGSQAFIVPEVTVTASPKLNIDYVAYRDHAAAEDGVDVIAIEAQAIDLRGGGVGPAWRAWEDGRVEDWRAYFTEEAESKNRRDTIDYGVNIGNVYKRLGTQVAVKGEYFRQIRVPFYVVTQHTILQQLRTRVNFSPATDEAWDIAFVGFDFDGSHESDGKLAFAFVEVVRTTLDDYVEALTSSRDASGFLRSEFIDKVKRKARKG